MEVNIMQTLLFILTIMSGVAMVGLVTYILVGMFDTSIATKKRLEAVSGELQRKKEKEEERKSLAEEYRAQKKQGIDLEISKIEARIQKLKNEKLELENQKVEVLKQNDENKQYCKYQKTFFIHLIHTSFLCSILGWDD